MACSLQISVPLAGKHVGLCLVLSSNLNPSAFSEIQVHAEVHFWVRALSSTKTFSELKWNIHMSPKEQCCVPVWSSAVSPPHWFSLQSSFIWAVTTHCLILPQAWFRWWCYFVRVCKCNVKPILVFSQLQHHCHSTLNYFPSSSNS